MNHAVGMPCPVCNVVLVMSERQGVEIDYCPQCRGVWLDRGELDKIIERNASEQLPVQSAPPMQARSEYPTQQAGYQQEYYHKKRKKSFLEDLFD